MAKTKRVEPQDSSTPSNRSERTDNTSDVAANPTKLLRDIPAPQQRPSARRAGGSGSVMVPPTGTQRVDRFDPSRATTPPDLNYNQRKRWRRKRRRAGFETKDARSGDLRTSLDRTLIQPLQASQTPNSSTTERAKTSISTYSQLEQVSRTSLVRRPTKQWILDAQRDRELSAPQSGLSPKLRSSPSRAREPSAAELAQARVQPSLSNSRYIISSNDAKSSPQCSVAKLISEETNTQPWKPTTQLLALRKPRVLYGEQMPEDGSAPPGLDRSRSPSQWSEAAPTQSRPRLRDIRMDHGSCGSTVKPITSLKASSVPSYSGRDDVKGAFERFNAWATGTNGSSDEQDSSSDSDIGGEWDDSATKENVVSTRLSCSDPPRFMSTSDTADAMPADTKDTVEHSSRLDRSLNGSEPLPLSCKPKPLVRRLAEDLRVSPSRSSDQSIDADNDVAYTTVVDNDNTDVNLNKAGNEDTCETWLPPTRSLEQASQVEESTVAIKKAGEVDTMSGQAALLETARDLPLFADWIHNKENRRMEDIEMLDTRTVKANDGIETARLSAGLPKFSSNMTSHEDESDADPTDVFKEIDDVARGVFGATRALPFGKPHLFQDAAAAEHITDDRSDVATPKKKDKRPADSPLSVRLSRSTTPENPTLGDLAPRSPSPYSRCFLGVRRRSPMVFICNSVQIDDVEVPPISLPAVAGSAFAGSPHNANLQDRSDREDAVSSSSELSELSRSPTPPSQVISAPQTAADHADPAEPAPSPAKKRKMTGITSRHFSRSPSKQAQTPVPKRLEVPDRTVKGNQQGADGPSSPEIYATPRDALTNSSKRTRASRKSTAKTSAFFTPAESPLSDLSSGAATPVPRKRRVPAGKSTAPVPSIKEGRFGLIQEKLWDQPFWLLIAVTFLNKTAGKAAAPIFWRLRELYPTPKALSEANEKDLVEMIYHLGLQTQRAKRLIKIAKAWSAQPPIKGKRYRTLHYPVKGDGKEFKKDEIIEEDSQDCAGALEIGHIPGCGPYAWDSWRIFCRDPLRGMAEDYNGNNHVVPPEGEDFVPEWQRVVPLDKELRACLRWMWLREGWIWNHETGERRTATKEEMEKAELGQMDIDDAQERKFAAQAAGVEVQAEEKDPMIEAATAIQGNAVDVKTPQKRRKHAARSAAEDVEIE